MIERCKCCNRLVCKETAKKPSNWAKMRGIRVYNYALLDDVTDSEFESRIAAAVDQAFEDGMRRGMQTLEERLGA
jgi:hypothetical protein